MHSFSVPRAKKVPTGWPRRQWSCPEGCGQQLNRAGSHVESAIPSNRLVLVEIDGTERLYFVVETKFSLLFDELRDQEAAKIECGEAHFKALATSENPAKFMKATNLNDVLSQTELI